MPPTNTASRIPELSDPVAPAGVIRVGENRDVPLTSRVAEVIDHPMFQRLRRVRQLGPTHLVYPGAVHTRFEHSIGAYGNVRAFVRALLRTPAFADAATEADILVALAAGLLHDVGHYPFAHSLEALHYKGRDTPRHEDLAAPILRGEVGAQRGARPLADVLSWRWGIDPERVIRLLTVPRRELVRPMDRVLQSIVSGAIDADKMDYLERDSTHLGVPYGKNYDRDRLIGSLTLDEAEEGLAIWAKGKVSAEVFVFCRYTMFSEAYWHHTVRAASAMVEAALADHVARVRPEQPALVEALLSLGDDALLDPVRADAPMGSTAAHLLAGLTGDRRRLHKRIATFSRVYAEDDKQRAYDRLYGMDAEAAADMVDRVRGRIERLLGHPVHPSAVLIDIPPRDKDRLESIPVRFPSVRGRAQYPLHELSGIVAGVAGDFVRVVKKIRVYCAGPVAAELTGRSLQLEEALLDEVLAR